MNLTDEQKRTLRTEYKRTLAVSEHLLRQREVLWRQSLGVKMLDCDGRMTERTSAVRGWGKSHLGPLRLIRADLSVVVLLNCCEG